MSDSMNASDIDSLLDATLDDLEDLPSYDAYPAGVHRVLASLSFKEVNGNTVIELALKALETVELANPSDTALAEGAETSLIFMLNNEYGRGNLKKVATPIAAALGTGSIRDTVEAANDVECLIVTSLRADKNDKDKKYTNVKELQVV